MEGVIGVVTCFACDFAPRNWALCNGQILSIAPNQALFSLLGITYGGNGQTTFGLPDLRGRAPVCEGQGVGVPQYILGQTAGTPTTVLTVGQLPAHGHNGNTNFTLLVDSADGTVAQPDFSYPAGLNNAYSPTSNGKMLDPVYDPSSTIANAGEGQPINFRSPFLPVNYIICLTGIYPSRS